MFPNYDIIRKTETYLVGCFSIPVKGGYSARVNIDADGSTAARWLENAKGELDIPW